MNFIGIQQEFSGNPRPDKQTLYNKFTEKEEKVKEEVARVNGLIPTDFSAGELTNKELYSRKLVDNYIDLLDNMFRNIDNISGGSVKNMEIERKKNELIIDICNEKIEGIIYEQRNKELLIQYYVYKKPINLTNNKYLYYPSIYDSSGFITKLIKKKEYYDNQNKAPDKTQSKSKGFRKSTSQKFAKNYISENTPYNGILLWHEVGVGKTCAAIGIAENFKNIIDSPDKKTVILTPGGTLIESWYNEIFNIKKQIKNSTNNYNQQCTGNTYTKLKIVNVNRKSNYNRIKKRRNKIINQYYHITGYQTFVNKFDTDLKKYIQRNYDEDEKKYYNRNLIKYIKERYSNRVFILDEVQYTREDENINNKKTKNDGKQIRKCLELICRYGKNNKFVLLSATPMYDKATEIIWLINLLRLNDKRNPLDVNDYFKHGKIINSVKDNFLEDIRGYISYQRGEDPFVFPTKLYPFINNADWKNLYIPNNKECLIRSGIYEEIAQIGEKSKIIKKDPNDVKYLTLYQNFMNRWQYRQYSEYIKKSSAKEHDTTVRQYSNIILPTINDSGDLLDTTSDDLDKNFKKLFTKERNKYTIHQALIQDNKSILHKDNISKYSTKFKNILNIIDETEGIIFIYSQFVSYGALLLAMCLEENGYNQFKCNAKGKILQSQNLVKNPTRTDKNNFNYILLTGSTPKNVLNKLKDYVNAPDNKDGSKIKIIIGTSVVEQGLSFFNVRQIHILDPWFNKSSYDQVIGRAVRRYSHHMLEENKRNVTIYLHIATYIKNRVKKKTPGKSITLTRKKKTLRLNDEKMYYISSEKYEKVLEIEWLLKRGAVDCNLNKKGNIFKNLSSNISSIDARNNDRGHIPLNDFDGSIRCNLTDCDYICYPNINLEDISINKDTYNKKITKEKITIYIEEIKNIFSDIFAIDIKQLKDRLHMKIGIQDDEDNLISEALNTIIKNKQQIYNNITNNIGFIIKKDKFYVYQEHKNDNELIKNKYLPVQKITKDFYIDDIEKTEKTESTLSKKKSKTIDNLIDLLTLSIYESLENYWEDAMVMVAAQGVEETRLYEQFTQSKSINEKYINKHPKTNNFQFGDKAVLNLETIMTDRIDTWFKKGYTFNNYRVSVFNSGSDEFDMTTIKNITKEKFILTSTVDKTITKKNIHSKEYILNRFYNRTNHPKLPNIYDIIYNKFLTYLEDNPLKMRNDILKSVFKEVEGMQIQDLIDSFFIYKGSDLTDGDQKPYRIDFNNLNDRTILKTQVLKIFFYSYFSSKDLNITINGKTISQTHPYRKFSYFLTEQMLQIAEKYKLSNKADYNSKNITVDGNDKITYLVIPTSSKSIGKGANKTREGNDHYELYYIESLEEKEQSLSVRKKHYFNSFFPQIDNSDGIITTTYLDFFKSAVYSFIKTLGTKKNNFFVVNNDLTIDEQYEVPSKTAHGKIDKKKVRKGASCGTSGKGVKTKADMGKLINAMIFKLTGNDVKYQKYGLLKKWKTNPSSKFLCSELNLILRHLDTLGYIDNSISSPIPLDVNTRYFYHEHIKNKIDRTRESL